MTAGITDVAVVGAGPAGRALAHRLLLRGMTVTIVDPRPGATWRPTYACWTDELPPWLPAGAVSAHVSSVEIRTPDATRIARGYSVLDNAGLQRALTVDGARIVPERATRVAPDHVITDSGIVRASTVVDARGTSGQGPRQTAFGVVVTRERARPVLGAAEAVLMDWAPLEEAAGATFGDSGVPSFLYAIPLDDERVLLEETCLAGDPPLSITALRARLQARLGRLTDDALDTESVSFSLEGVDSPWRRTPLPFGARGGLLHPATGYSVGMSLAAATVVADAVAAGRDPADDLWPTGGRAVHRLRTAGLHALLALDADQTREFFAAFARLPVARQRAYLSGRTDLSGSVAAMLTLFGRADHRTRRALARAVLTGR
ncbi:lycopene cyclase family protein [Gordonia sp. OPL2]|uniref:lycopene cyclase family protein n=1 Tax=Gordonia sp. OPL2 TaxID=2486274 RepID=UPI0021CCADDB|nr:lycopene cyclase family protein [Gordonia sp. OPL2]